MSLLLANGHPDAWSYPLGFLFQEAGIVVERLNTQAATDASLLQLAISSIPNMSVKPTATKKLAATFQKTVKALLGE